MGALANLPSKLRLLQGLQSKPVALGTFLMLPSAWTARIVASTGWDYVIVDCEHGNISDSDMHDSVNAISGCGVSPIVRISGTDPTLIKRALDSGAHGLMIPMINTASQAREVVRASKFPPLGLRGQGSPFSAMGTGMTTPEYLKIANEVLLTIVQIESVEGLSNVDEICQVDGVDLIFIGPNDLAMSILGYAPANYDEEPFLSALNTIRDAARRAGKPCGILCADGNKARSVANMYQMIAIGGDVKTLQLGMAADIKAARC